MNGLKHLKVKFHYLFVYYYQKRLNIANLVSFSMPEMSKSQTEMNQIALLSFRDVSKEHTLTVKIIITVM